MKLTNFCKNGMCSNCGQCCSDTLHLSHDEIKEIDKYLKEHKITPTKYDANTDIDNRCPFRDDFLKRCMIYPVRPEICKIFKCDTPVEKAVKIRDFTNYNKLPRSMRLVFFNDNRNQKNMKKLFNLKVYGRD